METQIYLPSTLEAINAQKVNTELNGTLGMADGGALVQDNAASGLEFGNDWARAVSGRLDDADAFVDDGLGVGAVVGRVDGGQQGDVDGKGVLCQCATLLDLLAQVGGRGKDEGGDDAQAASIGNRRGKFSVPNMLDIVCQLLFRFELLKRKGLIWCLVDEHGVGRITGSHAATSAAEAKSNIPSCRLAPRGLWQVVSKILRALP